VGTVPKWIIRFVGITGLTFLSLFIFFNYVGKTDVGWALPWTKPFRLHWPDLPIFASWKTTTPDGRQETIYQVPSRQLTPAEIAHLRYTPGATNAAPATALPPTAR
jgi:hypothetical protein